MFFNPLLPHITVKNIWQFLNTLTNYNLKINSYYNTYSVYKSQYILIVIYFKIFLITILNYLFFR